MLLIKNKIYKIIFSMLLIFFIRAIIIFNYGPNVVPKGDDHPVYHSTAVKLATDQREWTRPGSEFGYRAPLYFIFLSAIYSKMQKPKYQIGQILNAILGTISCLIIFLFVRNYYNENTAWVSFWIRGLLPSFILSDTFVLSEPLFDAFLLIALLILTVKTSNMKLFQFVGIGICMALCVLTREAALLYPIIFLFILIINSDELLTTIKYILLYCICFIIVLMPWLWRNEMVWGRPFPLSYTAGVNLHIGNNFKANGHWVMFPSKDMPMNIKFGTPEFSNWHMQKGIEYIKEDPVRFLKLGFKKVAWFLFPSFHREDLVDVYGFSNKISTIVGIIIGISSAILIIFGILGFVFAKHDLYFKITLVLILYSLIVTFIVVGGVRYRDPIDNLLIVYMAQSAIGWRKIKLNMINLKDNYIILNKYIFIVTILIVMLNWIWVLSNK